MEFEGVNMNLKNTLISGLLAVGMIFYIQKFIEEYINY